VVALGAVWSGRTGRAKVRKALPRSHSGWLSVLMHFQAALQAFLRQLEGDGRSPHTIGQYRRHGTSLATWLATTGADTDVAALTPDLVARFFSSAAARTSCHGEPKKAVSLNAMRTSIRCFAAHLHESGLIATNPARLLRRARCAPPPPKALHQDEQKRLLAVLGAAKRPEDVRDCMLVELLLGTGVRLGIALGLDAVDIDLDHGEIHLRSTKNDRPATAMLPKAIARKLRAFLAGRDDGPVFLAGDHRISMRHAQRRLRQWMSKAGITGKSAHAMRHTFASNLLQRTGDLRLVQAALNHASIVSTTIYTSVDRARLRRGVGA
jgi:integrase/recombinase XerC